MKTNEIKKGMKIKTSQLGVLVNGIMMDNLKGNIRMIKTHGTEIGLFDEIGSVYATDIQYAESSEGVWKKVEHTEKQKKSQIERKEWGL